MDGETDAKNNLHNNYVQVKREANIYETKILTGTDSQTSDGSVDTESRETTKSFQNLDVLIKEEPGTDDTRGHYIYNETEGIEQPSDHQSGNSGENDLHVNKETSCLVSQITDYAVCIKYEPNSGEVSKSYPKSACTTTIGKPYHQTNDNNGTVDNADCYEKCINTSDDAFKGDVKVYNQPIKCEIHESDIQKQSTKHSVPCGNIDNIVHTYHVNNPGNRTCDEQNNSSYCNVNITKPTLLDKKQYKCEICSFSFVTSRGLATHKQSHIELGEKRYKCDVCNYSTYTPNELARHTHTCTRKRSTYTCDICGYSTTWPDDLMKHRREHTQEYPYKCNVCSYNTDKCSHLEAHKRKHTEKPHKCDVCSYSTYTPNELARHTHTCTRKRSTYTCDICGYSSAWSDDLMKHRREHTQEYPYKCNVCSYNTDKCSHLEAHKRKHTEKPYKCDVCSYNAPRFSDLAVHKRQHTGEKPYTCDDCSYSTFRSSDLARHKRIHFWDYNTFSSYDPSKNKGKNAGEKPFKCDVCSYSSILSSQLILHKRKHIGDKQK